MIQYHKEVISYLRTLGALNIDLVPGGKHPRIHFDYNGSKRSVLVAKTPTVDLTQILKIKKGDIRRMLGLNNGKGKDMPNFISGRDELVKDTQPFNRIEIPGYEKKKEVSKIEAKKEISGKGTTAFYPGSKIIRFKIPSNVVESLPKSSKFGVIQSGKNCWEFVSEGNLLCRKDKFGNWYYLDASRKEAIRNYSPFYSTDTEFVVIDNHIFATLTKDPELIDIISKEKLIKDVIVSPKKDTTTLITKGIEVPSVSDENWIVEVLENQKLTREHAKAVLLALRYIEMNSSWKLVRLNQSGIIVFDDRIE